MATPRPRTMIPFALLAALVIVSASAAWLSSGSAIASAPGPEGVAVLSVPVLAPAGSAGGSPVDGITCRTIGQEKVTYHVHVLVAVYVNGRRERLPAGIGITSPSVITGSGPSTFVDVGLHDCLYWLHTHANDGVIHVEAPAKGHFTLGQFFDVWGQPLTSDRVGPTVGHVVVFENGVRYARSPRAVPLLAGDVIQIDVGSPTVAFAPIAFHVTGLCGEGTSSCVSKPS
ncbi:MAG: hypothetical protein KGJ92_01485 [Actinomycetales bacterium]|nr:hypothetical protein [Actinomycetales bacterium]